MSGGMGQVLFLETREEDERWGNTLMNNTSGKKTCLEDFLWHFAGYWQMQFSSQPPPLLLM